MTIAVIDGHIDTSIPELRGADIQDMTACTIQTNADSDDHATFIAQLLVAPDFGVAPGATIYNYAVAHSPNDAGADCGLGTNRSALGDQASLIEQALNDGVDIISISATFTKRDAQAMQWAVSRAVVEGVPIVGAMGNDGQRDPDNTVAAWGGVIGVSALETDGSWADYSNWGDGVTVAAVGKFTARRSDDGELYAVDGTSFAAPLVAGVLALAWQRFDDNVSSEQILQALAATARGSGGQWNERTGYGEIDPAALLGADPSQYPDVHPFEEKGGNPVVTPDLIDDYYDGLANPSSVYNDDAYVYRGLDEEVVSSGASGYPAHLGTSPRYHAQ